MNNPLVEAWMKSMGWEPVVWKTKKNEVDVWKKMVGNTYMSITLAEATFFYNESIKARIDELKSLTRIYDGEVRAAIMLDLKDRIDELQAQLIQDKETE